MYITGQHVKVR